MFFHMSACARMSMETEGKPDDQSENIDCLG